MRKNKTFLTQCQQLMNNNYIYVHRNRINGAEKSTTIINNNGWLRLETEREIPIIMIIINVIVLRACIQKSEQTIPMWKTPKTPCLWKQLRSLWTSYPHCLSFGLSSGPQWMLPISTCRLQPTVQNIQSSSLLIEHLSQIIQELKNVHFKIIYTRVSRS